MARKNACANRRSAVSIRPPVPNPAVSRRCLYFPPHARQRPRPLRHVGPRAWANDLHPLWRARMGRWIGLGRRIELGRLSRGWLLGRGRLVRWRRRFGKLVMQLTEDDRRSIEAAIREAEKRTCGQIVCVLARSSSDYSAVPIEWAAALALIVPWPLIYFTQLSVERIFLLQIVVFVLAGVI